MYSFLFSFVTSIAAPPGLSSISTRSPNRSSSVVKVCSSSAWEMSFSLRCCQYRLVSRSRTDVQQPGQTLVKICVATLHICKRYFLPENHLVEGADEESIEETPVEDGQPNNSADEFEVVEMLRVDAGVRVDLKSVVIVSRVFEQTVERIEHLVRQEKEKFSGEQLAASPDRLYAILPGQAPVIKTVFAIEFDH